MRLVLSLCAAIVLMAILARRRARRSAAERPDAEDRRAGIIHRTGNEVSFGCGDPGDPHVDRRVAVIRRPGKPDYVRAIRPSQAGRQNCHDCFLATGREEPERSSSG